MRSSDFQAGDKVMLKSFHNKTQPPADISESENYWKLVGASGCVVSDEKKTHPAFPGMGERLLIKFDNKISTYGLHCHNEDATNSLWIFISDLAAM